VIVVFLVCFYLTHDTLQGKIVELEKAITGLKAANTRKTTDDMSKVQDENRRLQVCLDYSSWGVCI
jgi:hypothetical protein